MGREKRREPCLSSSLPPSHRALGAFLPFSPVFLRRKKASARGESTEAGRKRPLQTKFCYPANYLNPFQATFVKNMRANDKVPNSEYVRIIIKSEKC